MDIMCPSCGEPWDLDCLHDEAAVRYGKPYYIEDDSQPAWARRQSRQKNPAYSSQDYGEVFKQVQADFRRDGCAALTAYGATCNPVSNAESAMGATVAYDLFGDDLDGAAAMLESVERPVFPASP